MSSGGATFTPRIYPRPTPLSSKDVLASAIISNIRVPFLCAALTKAVEPAYFAIAKAWLANGWSERWFFIIGLMLVHLTLYVGMNGFFLYCDVNGVLEKYKLRRTATMGPSWDLIYDTWKQAFIGQFIIGPPTGYFIYDAFKYFGMPAMDAPLPSFFYLMAFYSAAHIANGHLFYWSHRLVHSKMLYKFIHKQHHMYKGTIGFSAEYANPIEQIVSNQGPTVIGCLLAGSHVCVFLLWIATRLEQTYEGHSGYCFYGTFLHKLGLTNAEGAAFHDFHHTGNRYVHCIFLLGFS